MPVRQLLAEVPLKPQKGTLVDDPKLNQSMIEMAALQHKLRSILLEKVNTGVGYSVIATETKLGYAEVKDFALRKCALGSKRKVTALCSYLEHPELIEPILRYEKQIPTRTKAFTTLNEDALKCVLNIFELSTRYPEITASVLSQVFGEQAQVVENIIHRRLDAALLLENDNIRVQVEEMLSANFDEQLDAVKKKHAKTYNKTVAKINELYVQLREKYGGHQTVATKLKIDRGTLRRSLRTAEDIYSSVNSHLVSKETQDTIIAKATSLLNKVPDHAAATTDLQSNLNSNYTEEVAVVKKVSEPKPDSSNKLPFGETLDGVPEVVTSKTFREIEVRGIASFEEALQNSSQSTRKLLGIGAQISSDEIRQSILTNSKLQKELMQLKKAIEVFAWANPGEMLRMYEKGEQFHRQLKGEQ